MNDFLRQPQKNPQQPNAYDTGGAEIKSSRPEAVMQQKLHDLASKSSRSNLVSQLKKGKKKKKEEEEEPAVAYTPSHGQEEIQDSMIQIWQANALNDQDQLRADYAWNYRAVEGGWCDGWSYVVASAGEELSTVWQEIDALLDGGDALSKTSAFNATNFARKASLYHIKNQDAPAAGSAQLTDYEEANFDLESTPGDAESWDHDEDKTLPMYVIKAEIKALDEGQTLRLTSPIHDAAVNCVADGYVVSETESHGVQKVDSLEAAVLILDEWRQECAENDDPFFSQSMVV
jgi:hypothetical protein